MGVGDFMVCGIMGWFWKVFVVFELYIFGEVVGIWLLCFIKVWCLYVQYWRCCVCVKLGSVELVVGMCYVGVRIF